MDRPAEIINAQYMFSIHRIMKVFSKGYPIQVCIQFNLFPRLMQTIDHGNPKNLFGLNTHRQSTLNSRLTSAVSGSPTTAMISMPEAPADC